MPNVPSGSGAMTMDIRIATLRVRGVLAASISRSQACAISMLKRQ